MSNSRYLTIMKIKYLFFYGYCFFMDVLIKRHSKIFKIFIK